MRIDLGDRIPGTRDFYWAEALWLPKWKIHVFPTEEQLINVTNIGSVLQTIRNHYKKPVLIHSWVRPDLYNDFLGGKSQSWHKKGGAVDFSIASEEISIDEVRKFLEPKLVELNIRMELGTPYHIHIDNRPVGQFEQRTFTP